MPDQTFASSLREYVLLDATKQRPLPLPWQPLIGALVVLSSQAKVTRRVLERLLQWRAFGLPTPVLWIMGSGGHERDSVERKMRGYLDEAGFVGDDAVCVYSESLSRAALVELGAAMDQALSIEGSPAPALDQREAVLTALENVVNERRVASYAPALLNVSKRLRGMTPAMKERAADCAIACLTEESARIKAVELLSALPSRRGVAEIRAALLRMLRESRTVSRGAREVWSLLVVWGDEALDPALCDLVCSEEKASARDVRWLELLSECKDPAVVERLKTWALSLPESDARWSCALGIVERATPMIVAPAQSKKLKERRAKGEAPRDEEGP